MKTLQDYIIMHHEETSFLIQSIRRQVFLSLLLLPFSMMKRPETEGITEKKTWERQSFPGKEREKRERKKQDDDEDAKTISSYTSPCFCLFLSLLLSPSLSLQPGHSLSKSIFCCREREKMKERGDILCDHHESTEAIEFSE